MQHKISVVMLAASLLAACGGSGGGGFSSSAAPPPPAPAPPPPAPPPPPPAVSIEGLYRGTTPGNQETAAFFLDDGRYYIFYSVVAVPALIAGVWEGVGTDNNGSYTSSNLKDFNIEGVATRDGSLSATYVAQKSVNGLVTYANSAFAPVTFPGTYSSDYTVVPTLASLAAIYAGTVAESRGGGLRDALSIAVLSNGAFTGFSRSGCNVSGQLAVRARGNALALTVTMGPAPCPSPGQVTTGIAAYNPATLRFVFATTTADRSNAVLFAAGRT